MRALLHRPAWDAVRYSSNDVNARRCYVKNVFTTLRDGIFSSLPSRVRCGLFPIVSRDCLFACFVKNSMVVRGITSSPANALVSSWKFKSLKKSAVDGEFDPLSSQLWLLPQFQSRLKNMSKKFSMFPPNSALTKSTIIQGWEVSLCWDDCWMFKIFRTS